MEFLETNNISNLALLNSTLTPGFVQNLRPISQILQSQRYDSSKWRLLAYTVHNVRMVGISSMCPVWFLRKWRCWDHKLNYVNHIFSASSSFFRKSCETKTSRRLQYYGTAFIFIHLPFHSSKGWQFFNTCKSGIFMPLNWYRIPILLWKSGQEKLSLYCFKMSSASQIHCRQNLNLSRGIRREEFICKSFCSKT